MSANPSTNSGFVAGLALVLKITDGSKMILVFWTVFEPNERSGCVPSIPESRMATPIPAPVMPARFHAASAPMKEFGSGMKYLSWRLA